MKKVIVFALALFAAMPVVLAGQRPLSLASPDNRNVVTVSIGGGVDSGWKFPETGAL